ncbi:MAG: sigma-70 family RNA polymerase sigma factor [Actinomycetota bacterium]
MAGPRNTQVVDLQERRDRDLIERIAAGGERAFGELYQRYASAALGLAHRVIADPTLAEDVVQEVFVGVWQKAATYNQARGSVRSWLLAQVHHKAVDVVRRESAERRRAKQPMADVPQRDASEEVVEEAWLASRRVDVQKALATLSVEQREVLELAYLKGMTQTQVSSAMNIPLGTVKSRTLAAMRRLHTLLGGSYDGGERTVALDAQPSRSSRERKR